VCHEGWLQYQAEEREASRRMWDEFDRTRPLNDPQVPEEAPEVRLQKPETVPLARKD
jgi:hypothetical protein